MTIRKSITSILLLLLSLIAAAREMTDKDMRRFIIECDVADTVMHAPDADSFWQLLQQTNRRYHKTARSLRGNGDRDIKWQMTATLAACDSYFVNVPVRNDLYDMSEHIVAESGIRTVNPLATLTITDEADIAIFGYPNGYMFATGGLYDLIEGDTTILNSLLAAELCHYTLQHAYAHSKEEKSRRRRQRAMRVIGGALLAGVSIAAGEATDGWFPAELGVIGGAYIASAPVAERYRMPYTPQQIIEADIVAYRYIQYITGSGRPYIEALARAGHDIDATGPCAGPDYPDVLQRIALLRYMEEHPDLRRRIKANKTHPRALPRHTDLFAPSNYR